MENTIEDKDKISREALSNMLAKLDKLEASCAFQNAYVLLDNNTGDSYMQNAKFVKFSDCTFKIGRTGYIDFIGIQGDDTYCVVRNSQTKKTIIKDIEDLHCQTPVQLFIELEIRGCLLFMSDLANAHKSSIELVRKNTVLENKAKALETSIDKMKKTLRRLADLTVEDE